MNMYSKMRMATIIRQFATGMRTSTAEESTAASLSSYYIRIPSFRTFASQPWRCCRGYGLLNFSPSISRFKISGFFARISLVRSQSTTAGFTISSSRQSYIPSKRADQKSKPKSKSKPKEHNQQGATLDEHNQQGAIPDEHNQQVVKSDEDAIALSKTINKTIMKLGKKGLWIEILNLYRDQKHDFNATNHATAMSQLGRIRLVEKDDPLFESFLAGINAKLHDFGIPWLGEARVLAAIVHGFAKMGLSEENSSVKQIMAFMGEVETAEWLFQDGSPQSISNCVWACGKLGIKCQNLFKVLDEGSERLLEHANPQEIANCVWACGKLGAKPRSLFDFVDQRAEWFIENGHPQAFANCLWACAALGIESPNLFQVLDQRADWLIQNGKPQEIANCVWACAMLDMDSLKLFKLLDERAKWFVETGNAQDISTVVWACGKLDVESPKLFRLLD